MRLSLTVMLCLSLTVGAAVPAFPADKVSGYLAPGEFDVASVLESAPRPGDPKYDTDRKIFRATRKMVGTPRWQLATNDADLTVPALLRDYSCSVGVKLTPENAPKLVKLVQRTAADTLEQTNRAKQTFARKRPFTIDRGAVCQPISQFVDKTRGGITYDYPSGHTTWGWTWATILTSIAPDRAQQILQRGRAYGDSRFVCGAHNESAVKAGMLSASATMALVSTKAAYQADLADARTEMSALRASNAPRPEGCDAEAALIAQRVMPKLEAASKSGQK